MTDYLTLDPANRDESHEPVKTKQVAHVKRRSDCVEIWRWRGRKLEAHSYPRNVRNLARARQIDERLDEIYQIPF